MKNPLLKLLNSPGTLAVLAVIALSIWVSQLDYKVVKPKRPEGKPIEQIINAPIPDNKELEWDKDFKSQIIPIDGAN